MDAALSVFDTVQSGGATEVDVCHPSLVAIISASFLDQATSDRLERVGGYTPYFLVSLGIPSFPLYSSRVLTQERAISDPRFLLVTNSYSKTQCQFLVMFRRRRFRRIRASRRRTGRSRAALVLLLTFEQAVGFGFRRFGKKTIPPGSLRPLACGGDGDTSARSAALAFWDASCSCV